MGLGTAIILNHFEKKSFWIDTLNLDLCPSGYLLCDGHQSSHFYQHFAVDFDFTDGELSLPRITEPESSNVEFPVLACMTASQTIPFPSRQTERRVEALGSCGQIQRRLGLLGSRVHEKEYQEIKLERRFGALKVKLKNAGFIFIGVR